MGDAKLFLEKDMQENLAYHPEIIEQGMEFSKKEEVLYGRRIDLLLKDSFGKDVIELKNTEITYEHIGQLIWYSGALMRAGIESPRMFLIGRKVHPVLQTAFKYFGIEWREFQPIDLIKELKKLNSPMYSAYQNMDNDELVLSERSVSIGPRTTMIPADVASLNYEVTKRFGDWFLNSHIPIQKIGPFFLVFNDRVEEITKGTGYWVGKYRRFSIINDDLICEGTVYFGSSGGDGKEHYLDGNNPQYLALDIGYSSKNGAPFQTGNHTFCLKLPLHNFVVYPSGDFNIEIPLKGPGLKESKGYINATLNEWNISRSFTVPSIMSNSKLLWEISKSIVAVGFLKQISKKRIKFEE